MAAARRLGRLAAEPHEPGLVLHDVVGREHRDNGIRRHAHRQFGGDRDRRAGIAPLRLENDMRRTADLLKLFADKEAIGVVRHDDRHVEDVVVGKHLDRHLEGRELADERDELLRKALARLGPYAGPGAATHDDGKYLHSPTPRSRRLARRLRQQRLCELPAENVRISESCDREPHVTRRPFAILVTCRLQEKAAFTRRWTMGSCKKSRG